MLLQVPSGPIKSLLPKPDGQTIVEITSASTSKTSSRVESSRVMSSTTTTTTSTLEGFEPTTLSSSSNVKLSTSNFTSSFSVERGEDKTQQNPDKTRQNPDEKTQQKPDEKTQPKPETPKAKKPAKPIPVVPVETEQKPVEDGLPEKPERHVKPVEAKGQKVEQEITAEVKPKVTQVNFHGTFT